MACGASPLVELTGDSGTGKTALLRSGLIPALTHHPSLHPVYIDSYGSDWDNGPLQRLAFALQQSLVDLDRSHLLAVGAPHPPPDCPSKNTPSPSHAAVPPPPAIIKTTDVFTILSTFQTRFHRTPLLIFDQFDDYQAAHPDKFRTQTGLWLSPHALQVQNVFWSRCHDLLTTGTIRVLIAIRSDKAPGLHSIRSAHSESYPLDRIEGTYLLALLNGLTDPKGGGIVVANPAFGWDRLKDQLFRDLTEDRLWLPIQALLVIRGLPYLPNGALTIAAYEHHGAAAGLEALYVQTSIRKTTERLRTANLRLESAVIRKALLAMVDQGAKEDRGTIPRPIEDIAAACALSVRSCSKRRVFVKRWHGKEAIPHGPHGRAVAAHRALVATGQARRATPQNESP